MGESFSALIYLSIKRHGGKLVNMLITFNLKYVTIENSITVRSSSKFLLQPSTIIQISSTKPSSMSSSVNQSSIFVVGRFDVQDRFATQIHQFHRFVKVWNWNFPDSQTKSVGIGISSLFMKLESEFLTRSHGRH